MTILFAREDVFHSISDKLVTKDSGVILSSRGISPLFEMKNSGGPSFFELPATVVLITSDR